MTLKKSRVLIAGVLPILLVLFFVLVKPQLTPELKISANDISIYLEDGDIICRLGDRLWSRYFKDISPVDKRFSHLGIIRINEGKISVIHAEGRASEGKDFVNEVDLDEFLEIAKAVGIYRLNGYERELISSTAMNYIGFPFDWNFCLEDDSKIYCTELLYVVLKETAPEIELSTVFQKFLNKEIIPLDAVSKSGDFSEILFFSIN